VIVPSRDGKGYAWDNSSALHEGWPAALGGRANVSAATGDIDSDGRVEVVFTTLADPSLVVFDMGVDVFREPGGYARRWWPMYGYNPERQGCLACGADAVVEVPETPAAARRLALAPPAPNPSGGPVALAFDLPASAVVTLTVYDVAGRQVRELLRGELPAGHRSLSWDGRDDGGMSVAAGVYYARLAVDAPARSAPAVRKITLLR
jgi:hypothetical protein